jgi:hypothetical protein
VREPGQAPALGPEQELGRVPGLAQVRAYLYSAPELEPAMEQEQVPVREQGLEPARAPERGPAYLCSVRVLAREPVPAYWARALVPGKARGRASRGLARVPAPEPGREQAPEREQALAQEPEPGPAQERGQGPVLVPEPVLAELQPSASRPSGFLLSASQPSGSLLSGSLPSEPRPLGFLPSASQPLVSRPSEEPPPSGRQSRPASA